MADVWIGIAGGLLVWALIAGVLYWADHPPLRDPGDSAAPPFEVFVEIKRKSVEQEEDRKLRGTAWEKLPKIIGWRRPGKLPFDVQWGHAPDGRLTVRIDDVTLFVVWSLTTPRTALFYVACPVCHVPECKLAGPGKAPVHFPLPEDSAALIGGYLEKYRQAHEKMARFVANPPSGGSAANRPGDFAVLRKMHA